MRHLNRIAAAALLAVVAMTSTGCAGTFTDRFTGVASAISGATVDPQALIIASNSFDAVQATASNYLRLRRCAPATRPVCREPAATRPIINAVRAGRKARNAAQDFVQSHPGQLGPQGLYDALTSSVATLQNIFTTYNVEAVR